MSFFSKFGKGTRSRFSKPRAEVPALPAPTEPAPITREAPAPAKEHDSKQKEAEPLDEALVPSERPVRERQVKAENKALEGQSSTEPHTVSGDTGNEGIYQIIWRSEALYRMVPVHNYETNTYVPNSMALFSLLEAAETRINVSKHIQQHEPSYCPYAVKLFYAYMYYIQILRARKDSGVITGFENSLLKRFEVKYPMSSLPCAEVVFPYFSTIIATELAEAKYDWIVPRIAIEYHRPGRTDPVQNSNMHLFTTANGSLFLQPLIPHMVALLNTFIHHDTANLPNAMIDGDTYQPVDIAPAPAADVNIFGVTINSGNDNNTGLKPLFSAAGLSTPMIFGNQNYTFAAREARRTDFGRDINLVVDRAPLAAGARATLVPTHMADSLDGFLLMEKTSDLRFFSYLRNQAVIHARFFDKVYHFSDVQTTGGLETTVISQLKLTGADRLYDDARVGITRAVAWYPQPFRKLQAGFATNRAGLRRNEELQAFANGTNSTLPITGLTDRANDLRTGSFWDNQEWIQTLFYDQPTANSNTGKPMFADHASSVLRCYREKPHGTGVVDNEFD